MPGKIQSYDATNQKAVVIPQLHRKLADGRIERVPVLNDVPVIWPRSGGAFMTFPVSAGDGCLLVFCERSLDEWKANGGEVVPQDPRAHALSDAVAIMGFSPFNGPSNGGSDVLLQMGGSSVRLSGSKITLSASEVEINGNLAINGGSVEHNGVNIGDDHVHEDVSTGTSDSGPPKP